MQSIFTTQTENTIVQAVKAKKEAKENKKVQFANMNFEKFIKKTRNIVQSASLSDNLENMNKTFSSKNSSFKGLNSFVSHFKMDELPQNSQGFEYSEELLDKLGKLIKEYQGTKGELKDAEHFLLGLMKELVGELDELGFDSFEFRGYYEAYEKQLAKKEGLKSEIVKLANKYLDAEDELHGEILLGAIANKLRDYHSALQDGELRSFFAPILQYLGDSIQENIIKALYTINEELQEPEAFELGGGARLVWRVDEERIKFQILSIDDLKNLYAEHQKSKTFKVVMNSYEQSDNDGDFSEPNLSESADLNLGANSAPNFGTISNLTLALKMSANAKANLQANTNAQSLLKGLLSEF